MTMTTDEYRAALKKLGLSQQDVGRLLHAAPRTVRRWATGETELPGPVEMHIRLWLERPELVQVVREISERA